MNSNRAEAVCSIAPQGRNEIMKMKTFTYILLFTALSTFGFSKLSFGQDPRLPPTNLGQVNIQDGNPPGTGWVYQQVLQTYNSNRSYGGNGELTDRENFSQLLSLQQVIHITEVKFLEGNLGYTAILPIVKLSATVDNGSMAVPVNPSPIGDLITGAMVQWFDRKIGNMKFAHRLELDAVIPIGAHDDNYAINPSAHFYTISLHYAFTLFPTNKFSVSMRNHLNYNGRILGTKARAGIFYNNNYSLEYQLLPELRIAAVGYYLKQLEQDTYNGSHSYYKETYGLTDTREQVFAYGIGMGFRAPIGTFIELKGTKETGTVNRTQGIRGTLVVNFKIN